MKDTKKNIIFALVVGIIIGVFVTLNVIARTLEPTIVKEVQYVPVLNTEIRYVPVYMNETSRGAERVIDAVATAYTYEYDSENITFSGLPAHVGVMAVDPDVIPIGSIWYVEGYGYAIAADTGHRDYIAGNRIDLFMKSKEEAKQFGVQPVRIHFVK